MTLKLGDVVHLGDDIFVVATITGLPPYWWQLVSVPIGKEPLDLGKTWKRNDEGVIIVSMTVPSPPSPSVDLEPPNMLPLVTRELEREDGA